MGFWRSMDGLVTAKLTSADPAAAICAINQAKIDTFRLQQIDDLTFSVQIRRRDYRALAALAARRGEKLRMTRRTGLYWAVKGLLRRRLFVTGLAVMLGLVLFLPTRVFFVRVEGNSTIPHQLIIEKAQLCGIGFGASRREVRSERIKNALLAQIPQLQWVGVNTSGCTAVISVRERTSSEPPVKSASVSRIVASRDGIITSMTVTSGNGICTVGQAVRAGETLVSGYTDCGISIQATRSQAEIFAQTRRELRAVTPANCEIRGTITSSDKKYSLIVGKKRINFYKDSGILDVSCAKMYKEICLTLPGGFELPVTLVVEEWINCEAETVQIDESRARQLLEGFAEDYLCQQMVAGVIQAKEEIAAQIGETFRIEGYYDCLEMIGRERSEEIIDGKTN